MKNDRHQAVYIPFRCSDETAKLIADLAKQRGAPKAEVARELVELGLAASGAKVESDHLYSVVKSAVEEAAHPSVERLAAISAKATQIASAAFFMSIWASARNGSAEEQTAIQEAVESARRLGIQYLKLTKDRDLDAFLREGAKQILD